MACDPESRVPLVAYEAKSPTQHFSLKLQKQWIHWLLCLSLGLVPAFVVWLSMSTHVPRCDKTSVNATPVPDMPHEMRTFEWNYTFSGLRSPESERAWDSITPFGKGYVFVPEPLKYGLPPGEKTPHGEIYSLALYHQLHCLKVIRRDYFDLLDGVWNNSTDVRTEAWKQLENSHNRHCMDYIRQTLECSADMTLEWERTEADGSRFQVDGMGITHECKSQSTVRKYMESQVAIVSAERKGADTALMIATMNK